MTGLTGSAGSTVSVCDWRECFSGRCEANLLPEQLVVHLHPLHLLVALLQLLVVLPQLSDVVTGFGQDPSFTLQHKHRRHALSRAVGGEGGAEVTSRL